MQIDVIHETALTPADDRAIAVLLADAFGPDGGYDGRSFYKQRFDLRLVTREEGRITGHVALLLREVRLGARHVPIIGVGEVGTLTSHRGRVIASARMTEAIAQARGTLAEFMVLFGVRPIYAGLGFRNATNPIRYVAVHDLATLRIHDRQEPSLMVLPLGNDTWDDAAPLDLLGPMF